MELTAVPANVHWGYFDRRLEPRLTVDPGDVVRVETVTNMGMGYPEGMVDDAIAAVYREVLDRGPGPHLLTGPIAVRDAEPGDSLKVSVLSLEPRVPFGICAQLPIGLLHEPEARGMATVFAADATKGVASGLFRFDLPTHRPNDAAWSVERIPLSADITVPLRPHLGVAGVASETAGRVSSIFPTSAGGNVDQWRFGEGTSMTYPVMVPEALFSCGDGHLAQGDGEISGNGIEAHLTAVLKFDLMKGRQLNFPILETPGHLFVHAFAPSLDKACELAGNQAIALLQAEGLDRKDAYTLLSIAGDFGITQVVNQQKGVHVALDKNLLTRQGPGTPNGHRPA